MNKERGESNFLGHAVSFVMMEQRSHFSGCYIVWQPTLLVYKFLYACRRSTFNFDDSLRNQYRQML